MLRTNTPFLAYIERLYELQARKEAIILKDFSKHSFVLQQGTTAHAVLFIKQGIIKCFMNEENGKEYIVEFLGKGEVVGEIEFLKNIPCLCTIEALTEVTAYSISLPYFKELIEKDPLFSRLLLDAFAERIINTSSRASYQQLHTVEHSYSKLMELQSRQNVAISKEDMAAYLGITIRTLNRVAKNFK
ncbi:Crp/Fnr family transcriptional regulator [Myroides ceti]|uniref:Crp/Fnr family transcriptional regulator n=2 Tax=Paenimyroides ceti TaxID=395087 RepID=A0ABT8CQ49_9FLAO|nr:Crp/Fnr family transcriptional regulator [Paenimyroides ceti]MDN3706639.1 Crp/Fnr family transcriptional regulator [Paenimyroides ceti]